MTMTDHLDARPLASHSSNVTNALPETLADTHDRFDLMRAIRECDGLIEALMQIRAIHTANLLRIANRLAAGEQQ